MCPSLFKNNVLCCVVLVCCVCVITFVPEIICRLVTFGQLLWIMVVFDVVVAFFFNPM